MTLFLWILALGFIWNDWGFWAFFWILVADLLLSLLGKREHGWDVNWFGALASLGVIILGIVSIGDKFQNPVITAVAVAVAIIVTAMSLHK